VEPEFGGTYLTDRLDELSTAIDNYYGMLNQYRLGIKPDADEIVDKPEALALYDMCKEMGIPRVEGCLEDQPYIWMLEWATAKNKVELHEHLLLLSQQQQQAAEQPNATGI